MKLLVDENLSPDLAARLTGAGHDAVHVRQVGLARATDAAQLAYAVRTGRVIVSSDSDFGELLARSGARRPSVVLLRRQTSARSASLFRVVLRTVMACGADLEVGAVVVADGPRLRVRPLPIASPSS